VTPAASSCTVIFNLALLRRASQYCYGTGVAKDGVPDGNTP
jgi:hypothetical protein